MHKNVRSGEGLDGVCLGPGTAGLRSQRSRLRRGLAPRLAARLADVRGPESETIEAWTARFPSLTGGARAGGDGRDVALSNSGPRYGTWVHESQDWAVAQAHGFGSPSEVVAFWESLNPRGEAFDFEEPPDG